MAGAAAAAISHETAIQSSGRGPIDAGVGPVPVGDISTSGPGPDGFLLFGSNAAGAADRRELIGGNVHG